LHEDGTLEYKIDTEPKITDPKIDLGLGGMLMERFLTSLYEPTSEMSNSDNSVDGN
jgi:hypothetical protein